MIEWKEDKPVEMTRLSSADGKWKKRIEDGYVCISAAEYLGAPVGVERNEHDAWVALHKSCDELIHKLTWLRAEVADIIKAQKKNGK